MAEINNKRMWESLLKHGPKYEHFDDAIPVALKDQGLEWNGEEIVAIESEPKQKLSDELTEFEKAIALLIFNSQTTCNSIKVCEEHALKESQALLVLARRQIASEINAYRMECKYGADVAGDFYHGNARTQAYRQGIDDVLKKLKGE